MASHLIGISGRKRSGKDTFAERLLNEHGFTRVSFAEPLRAMALAIDPWVKIEQDEGGILFGPGTNYLTQNYDFRLSEVIDSLGWEKAKEIREVRRLLQVIGTEGGREIIGQDVWVDAAARVVDSIPGPVVITDTRFPNEAAYIRRVGGQIVRVTRPGLPETDLHPSETALDALVADFPVMNDGTVSDLHAQADVVARVTLGRS